MAKVTMRIYGALSRHHKLRPNQTKPNKMKSTVFHCHSIAYRGPSRSPSLVLLHTFSLLHFNCFAFSTVIIIKFISKMINRNSTNSEHSLTRTNQIAIFYLHIHIRHVDPTDIPYRCTWFKFSFILHQPPKNDEENLI